MRRTLSRCFPPRHKPPPLRRRQAVKDEASGKMLWWNPATGEKTQPGMPKPKDEEAEHFTRSLWGSFAWAGVMGVIFAGIARLFGG